MTPTTSPVVQTKTSILSPRVATLTMLSVVVCGTLLMLTSWAVAGAVGSSAGIPGISQAYSSRFLAADPTVKPSANKETVSVLNEWQFTRLHVSKSR